MPLTRGQRLAGAVAGNYTFVQPTASQLKAQLRSLDLDHYIPLGSFLGSTSFSNQHYASEKDPSIMQLDADIFELTDNPSSLLAGNLGLAENLNLLLIYQWIRIFVIPRETDNRVVLRVYVLPDDVARELVIRDSAKLRSTLRSIISAVDCSSILWNGSFDPDYKHQNYISVADATDSLYYLFNNVSSPYPDPDRFKRDANYYAIEDILKQPSALGLRTVPYGYQQQSAAVMLAREAEPEYHIDPRFERKQSPTGEWFYLDCIQGTVVKEVKLYEDVRGGILAENMGSGKTLISLLLILSTRGHIARLPDTGVHSSSFERLHSGHGSRSLLETAARAVQQFSVPYKTVLQNGRDGLRDFVNSVRPSYATSPTGPVLYLSSTTLIIVPPNLIAHWSDEMAKHIQPGTLSCFTCTNDETDLPLLEILLEYDVILLSKARFEDEFDPRKSIKRRRNDEAGDEDDGLVCMCEKKRRACARHPYSTVLGNIHFLRVIIDEALGFSKGLFGNKASSALASITAERKWLVSGTPSKGLRGVEIDMAMHGNQEDAEDVFERQTLNDRRARPSMETEEEQVRQFGNIVTNFFHAKPWSKNGFAQRSLWSRYMIPDKYGKGKAGNLQTVVESLVVRHQINEVSKEVPLPPLSNRVVYLDACSVDKMALNLFTVQLVINAITSEREDQDYMFHPKQKTSLAKLFQNLRHANFYWTGLDSVDLLKTIETAERYAAKETTKMTAKDDLLLKEALDIGRKILENMQWQVLSASKEMGLFVEDFPEELLDQWSLTPTHYRHPLLMGATDVRHTQIEVTSQLYAQDPFKTLWRPAGHEIWKKIHRSSLVEKKTKGVTVKGISQSSYDTIDVSPSRRRKSSKMKPLEEIPSPLPKALPSSGLKSSMKQPSRSAPALPEAYNQISRTRLVATSSTKLSYLLDKIMEVHKEEKSIIFYEDANTGYWLAQSLEVLEIRHEIYAVGIKEALRSEYLHNFENGETTRVLLMDLKLGSHGLHLASVTRVFFVNPVWDETVEAQAIKRAHRTGQTKPVYIETLVLKGTLEDQMLMRRKGMTSQEIQQTARGPTFDPKMHDIIRNASFLAISDEEWSNEQLQCAPLKCSYQLYGREFVGHPSLSVKQNHDSNEVST